MKSGIYLGKNSIEIRETDIPGTVGDNDVLIKNIYSSICGTVDRGVQSRSEYGA